MLDKLLEVGSAFDWISPAAAFVQGAVNGPSHTFLIDHASCPLSGHEVEHLLRQRGVKTWGLMVVDGTLMITVKRNQAQWAQALLQKAGVPITNGLPAQKSRKLPRNAGRDKGSPFGVFGIFDE